MMNVFKALGLVGVLCAAGCVTPKEVFPPMHPQWSDHISRQSRHYANFPGKIRPGLKETKIDYLVKGKGK